MAVVQISRIQVRRGQKNTGTGLPQLASGELAWAVDTQELFIGNGSVAEGAPFVGNSKILTANDNILDLFEQYQYKKNDPTIQTGNDSNFPVQRTVQDRLDERVSIAEFGAVGDGITDDTAAIQRAINQLYLNPSNVGLVENRHVLDFLPGTYKITSTIYVPSFTAIEGAGKDRTVISYNGTGSAFEFVNDTSTIGNPSSINSSTFLNQCKHVSMKGFTVNLTTLGSTAFKLNAVRVSNFDEIGIVGIWTLVTPLTGISSAFELNALSSVVTTQGNQFNRINIYGMPYGVYAKQDILSNTFSNVLFNTLYKGISFGEGANLTSTGEQYGPRSNTVMNCFFIDILRQGIKVANGTGNLTTLNRFINVGSNGGGNTGTGPAYGQIEFDTIGNSTQQDIFDRFTELSNLNFTKPYISEVVGKAAFANPILKTISLISTISPARAFRLPIDNAIGHEVNYIYKSSVFSQMKKGKLFIAVDKENNNVQLVDEFEYTGTAGQEENLEFTASLVDSDSSGTPDCVQVYYTNSNANDSALLTFHYQSLS